MRRVLVTLMVVAASFLAVPAGAAHASSIYYRIINAKSHMCLNEDYTGGVARSDVIAYTCTSSPASHPNEVWRIDDPGNFEDEIVNKASGLCLNQDYADNKEHPDVIVYGCNRNYFNNVWDQAYDGSNVYFTNEDSGKYLNQNYTGGTPHKEIYAYVDTYVPPAALNSEWILQQL